jgi:hypothetical protein
MSHFDTLSAQMTGARAIFGTKVLIVWAIITFQWRYLIVLKSDLKTIERRTARLGKRNAREQHQPGPSLPGMES